MERKKEKETLNVFNKRKQPEERKKKQKNVAQLGGATLGGNRGALKMGNTLFIRMRRLQKKERKRRKEKGCTIDKETHTVDRTGDNCN